MAMACLRLVTFVPDRPLLSVPLLRRCMADLTSFFAREPYLLAMMLSPGSCDIAQLASRQTFEQIAYHLPRSEARSPDRT
jgi:hypothetical protein